MLWVRYTVAECSQTEFRPALRRYVPALWGVARWLGERGMSPELVVVSGNDIALGFADNSDANAFIGRWGGEVVPPPVEWV